MTIDELLKSIDEDDVKQVTESEFLPGIRHNSQDALDEVLMIYDHIPVLKSLVAKSVHYSKRGDRVKSDRINLVIKLLILIYKKDKNNFIDKLLKGND